MSSAPLRVLMISKALVVGAYQRKLELIAAQPGIDLTVVVPPYWGRQALERAHLQGYRLEVLPVRFNGSFHLHYYRGLGSLMRRLRPQVVHIDEEPYNLAAYQALRLAQRNGAKTLFFSWQNLLRRYPPPFNWMESAVLRHAEMALVGNQEAEQVWRAKGYDGPLRVIPQFGVDTDLFQPGTEPRPRRPLRIGYAGRLVPEKGLDLLIKAASLLTQPCALIFVGAGPDQERLRTVAGLHNIGGMLDIRPSVPSTQMPSIYREFDVLALPSQTRPNWKEQFGRVLIEAMACGLPVIGSDSGAIPEVIGEAGLIFREGDVYGLQEALERLIADPALYQALSRAGRARVIRHYTQERIAQETIEVYRSLIHQDS